MGLLSRYLNDKTVFWEPPIRDGFGGYKWGYPIEIMAKWGYSGEIVYSDSGSMIVPSSYVFMKNGADIPIGSYLWKGDIRDLSSIFEPNPDFDEWEEYGQLVLNMAAQVVKVIYAKGLVDAYGYTKALVI